VTQVSRRTAVLGLTALLVACDGASNTTAAPSGATTTESAAPHVLRFTPGSPPLRTYDTTFVTRQGSQRIFVISHEDGTRFMVLDVPQTAQFVDANGTPTPDGEPVNIRTLVDRESVRFEFQPHGSYFDGPRPVVLRVCLEYLDLGSSAPFPSIWYQADTSHSWSEASTTVDLTGRWLMIDLRHFSNYSVAW